MWELTYLLLTDVAFNKQTVDILLGVSSKKGNCGDLVVLRHDGQGIASRVREILSYSTTLKVTDSPNLQFVIELAIDSWVYKSGNLIKPDQDSTIRLHTEGSITMDTRSETKGKWAWPMTRPTRASKGGQWWGSRQPYSECEGTFSRREILPGGTVSARVRRNLSARNIFPPDNVIGARFVCGDRTADNCPGSTARVQVQPEAKLALIGLG